MGTILGGMFKKVGGGLGKVFAPMNRRFGGRGPERCR